ncbi:putative circularly permuted ATP-grasp superfamily protein/putative alpha-E superfamily protein [Angulomicrobium tetraedrale]|uniref:Putative circularly permuted ATP-grasp superfamily protein/putative alpha-E superfamily protein n=1 Tax=Ancylobacter tetraedralis TaxID=217068 RepID=A0A839ZEV6_9HYPH|nr:circularly permuted type 2 ATP-grasp protein [Ancylobacter tetraedralis]MBB3773228.1 putative circularly permuted ATP-grasp superfamily protein/putative alpha-E superfamily protein [Ancylobacter tetraedralis]
MPRRSEPQARTRRFEEEAVEALLAGYKTLPGVHDELVDAEGHPRAHWHSMLAALAEMGVEEVNRRFQAADRHLYRSGVFYRVYDDPNGGERPWPLSHLPLVIDEREWQALERGLIQRAQLVEGVLADIYGDGQLVRSGALPAAAIAGSPDFLRPMVGVDPNGGTFLRIYAADVGRGPDGSWWVVSDRTQSPSGAGYALENRIAIGRALPDLARSLNVVRLASYFQAMRAGLTRLDRSGEGRVGLLTPGPLNETYFEHAYLARYLGFVLLEGEDLTVRDNVVFVRTVAGLKRVDVLLRRLDSDYADPLELNSRSRLGIPGLVQAIRSGGVAVVNAVGVGVVEAPALMGFLPKLGQRVLGEAPILPNVATWWCGQKAERERVLDSFEDLVISPAFQRTLPGLLDKGSVIGADLDRAHRARIKAAIRTRGVDFVGQEAARLSTMPVWCNGKLQPRPFILRIFLTATETGWKVMPGGFCRVSDSLDARAVTMQSGGRSTDVWVLDAGPTEQTSLLPAVDRVEIKRQTGPLPSRAADNFFWLGRYIERAETTLRLLRTLMGRLSSSLEGGGSSLGGLVSLLQLWGAMPADLATTKPARHALAALTRRDLNGSLPNIIEAARHTASVIRDRLSPDAWRTLADLSLMMAEPVPAATAEPDAYERSDRALRALAAFSGLASENMNRLAGWRFLDLGRRIERAIATCRFARTLAGEAPTAGALDVLLELCDSQITYRSRYVMVESRAPVLDLVLLESVNPRSLAYQIDAIMAHLDQLPGHLGDEPPPPEERLAARLVASMRAFDALDFDDARLREIEGQLMELSNDVAERYFIHRQPVETPWDLVS